MYSTDVQSAYKRFHSTETALLKIDNDIICNMDKNDWLDILAFLVQFFNGSNHTFQTDSNEFI